MSIWHWGVLLFWALTTAIPLALFQRQVGQSGWLSLIAAIPLGFFVVLWVVALTPWPKVDRR